MTYTTTMTKKGQITIPKPLRDILQFKTSSNLLISFNTRERAVMVRQTPDIVDIAGRYKAKNRKNVLKAREAMEYLYERS